VVNDVATEKPAYSTTRLARAASTIGHDVWYMGTDDFAFDADDTAAPAEVTDTMLRIAEVIRPKLVRDGMFFVGVDIAGDKLLEINVFSPGDSAA
jgi:glutathione synthase/RimK-type ligase-like ATP-grasp enzyme